MTDPYALLGLPPDAGDAEVRARYLALTREFPPEQHPEKSAAVRLAYDQLRTADARAQHRLFGFAADDGLDALIEEVRCSAPRQRPTLAELFKTLKSARP